jgi:hypothetical protein
VIRLAARRLWTRRLQALAPLVALLAATLGFQAVLVSARSTQSHVQGVIAANWNPPYDLLVHPASLVTGLTPGDHLLQPNYLLTAQGGITLQQVGRVRGVSGVSVAAPLGIVAIEDLQGVDYTVNVSSLPRSGAVTIFKVTTNFRTDGGQSVIPGRPEYLIVEGTQPPYTWTALYLKIAGSTIQCGDNVECFGAPNLIGDPGPLPVMLSPNPWKTDRFPYYTQITAPVVAVDPVAEEQLAGLNHCLTSGRSLTAADGVSPRTITGSNTVVDQVPVLMNATPGFDEGITATIQRANQASVDALVPTLTKIPDFNGGPTGPDHPSYIGGSLFNRLPFQTTVGTLSTTLNQAWNGSHGVGFTGGEEGLFARDSFDVDVTSALKLDGRPPSLTVQAALGASTGFLDSVNDWITGHQGDAPYESQDGSFRTVTALSPTGASSTANTPFHSFNVVGKYDSSCVGAGSPLSGSGYDIYGNVVTRQAGGPVLGPNGSVTNFVSSMPTLMTNLAGGEYFSDPHHFAEGEGDAFLSVIRVKVAGTSTPGPASQARLQRVAADIHRQTGLAVDIIKGSSTQPVRLRLPAGNFGRPEATVTQDWLTENVAINFFQAINNTTVVMSIVVAVVAVLLTMQTTYATVRRRRGELVLLRAIGWPSWRLALLMEFEVIGLGVIVALVALLAAAFMILVNHPGGGIEAGILLAAPAAILLTALAGAGPALTASRTRPLAALRGPGRLRRRRRRLIRGPFSLGIREALTTWRWQTLLGALATAVGALFLGAVLAILHDFHTSLDSTTLAQQLSNEVGPFDVLLGVLAVALGATTAVSVVLVATRERLPHFATLRALGWSRVKVAQVVAGQAISVGLLGGVLGVIALSILANRVKTGIALTWSSQLSPLVLGVATGIAAAIGAVRLVYRRVIVTVLRVG